MNFSVREVRPINLAFQNSKQWNNIVVLHVYRWQTYTNNTTVTLTQSEAKRRYPDRCQHMKWTQKSKASASWKETKGKEGKNLQKVDNMS